MEKMYPSKTVTLEKIPDAITGRYALYSGVQKTYIGHLRLNNDGTYFVALSSDESLYGIGRYTYLHDGGTLVWQSGLFFQNEWKGILFKTNEAVAGIKFNSQTFAIKTVLEN